MAVKNRQAKYDSPLRATLAGRGAHVIMALRSGIPEKGEEVIKKNGSENVDMFHVDLSDLDRLRAFPAEIKKRFGPIDILICNAAMVANRSRPVKEGLDEMFVVSYFAKYVLVRGMIGENCFNTYGSQPPRIIFVTSESHRNPENYDWEGFGKYEPYGIKKSVYMYGYYKLLLLTLANEFSRRLNADGKVNCPGEGFHFHGLPVSHAAKANGS